MTLVEVADSDSFKEMEDVAKHMLKGASEFAVARRLNLKVVEVRALWSAYKEQLNRSTQVVDAARDHLNMMVKQYDDLIQKAHENLDELDTLAFDEKVSAQRNTTIKTIGDLQAKRVDALQKAGLLDGADLGDELAEREERERIIIDILRNDLCPHCRKTVAEKLQKLTQQVEVTVVYDDE